MQAAPVAAAEAEPAAESALLRCLSQLNPQLNDVFSVHLLPKLVEQGSAGAVRLTCSQLCALLQPSIQHLDLSKQLKDADNPLHSPRVARQFAAAFPNCTYLQCAWSSSSMVNVYGSVSPLLAGLPRLQTVSIKLTGCSTAGHWQLDPVLCQLNTHATGLCCLQLQLETDYTILSKMDIVEYKADYTGDAAWVSLGKMVSLTRLQLSFDEKVTSPFTQQDLRPLTGLSKLQVLDIYSPGAAKSAVEQDVYMLPVDAEPRLAVEEFPGCLTALTKLQLSLEADVNLSSISGCLSLQDLQVRAVTTGRRRQKTEGWDPREWAALAQLSKLTRLHVDVNPAANSAGPDGFYSLLQKLTGLRSVGAWVWDTSRYLPLMQSLTHLTEIYGGWSAADGLDVVCPHVRELREACNEIPFAAFPNLAGVSFYEPSPEHILSLSRNCPVVEKIKLTDHPIYDDGPVTAAFRSLAKFKHLTHLELPSCEHADFAAFVSAAAAAGAHAPKLQFLHMHGPVGGMELMQLPQLVSVCCVRELSVAVHFAKEERPAASVDSIGLWLVGLAVVPKVLLTVWVEEQKDMIDNAILWAASENDLPLPASLRVAVVERQHASRLAE